MDIYSSPGSKVVFTGQNGHDLDLQRALTHLAVGDIYTVNAIQIESWMSIVSLKELPRFWWNTVMFKNVNGLERAGTKAANKY